MDRRDRSNAIWLLMRKHHPVYTSHFRDRLGKVPILIPPKDGQELTEAMREAKAHYDRLLAMPDDELALLADELAKERHTANERIHWSNKPPAVATSLTYDYWSKASYWSIDEAAALLSGRDPAAVTYKTARSSEPSSDTIRSFLGLRDLVSRAINARQIDFNCGPGGYLAWARRNRIEIPAELEKAVHNHGHQIDDWKSICDRQAIEIAELKASIAQLEAAKAGAELAPTETTLGSRERDSLLKLVIGMAIKGYAYDPKVSRSPGAKEIADDLAKVGIPLDPDTVRKYLNEAKELLPPPEIS